MKSLGSRLTIWYVLVVSATVILALLAGRWLLEAQLIRGMDLLNAAEFRELSDRVETKHQPAPRNEMLQKIAAHSKIDAPVYFFQVRDTNGEVAFRSANMGDAVFPQNPAGKANCTLSLPILKDVRIGEFRIGDMHVQIAASMRDEYRLLRSYFKVSLVMLGIASSLSIFFGYRMSRLALDPVRRIQRIAQKISAENLSVRIPTNSSQDEIADLSRLLNQMFDRLEVSFERLWRFAADASHELRTPLSLIRLQSERLMLEGPLTPSQNEAVQQQLESISRLDSVIEKLLFLAKSEVGAIRLKLKRQNTRDFIEAVEEDAHALCDDREVKFILRESASLDVAFDGILLRQVILNLLTNALHVTPKGGCITFSSICSGAFWKFTVEDTGPGLPTDRVSDVFLPFVRVPQSNADTFTGTGLGLAICRSILDLHHGEIRAENREPGPGLRVTFQIPIAQPVANERAA